jgi:DNA-binding response OmpR family regulator
MPAIGTMQAVGASPIRRAPLILVVNEDESERSATCRVLRAHGYRPMPASHGVDANWVVERHGGELALVVTDLMPPAPDGYHLGIPFATLRPYTPVLFTAHTTREENVRRGLLHPSAPYLQTPATPTTLARRVREVIASWPALPAA